MNNFLIFVGVLCLAQCTMGGFFHHHHHKDKDKVPSPSVYVAPAPSVSVPLSPSPDLLPCLPRSEPIFITEEAKIFHPAKGRILTFVRSPMLNFVDAVAACASRGQVLAEFRDREDIRFLNEAMKNTTMPNSGSVEYINVGGMYAGPVSDAYDRDTTKAAPKVFKWFESGQDITLWGPDQPDKLKGKGWDEDCVVIYPYGRVWTVGDHTCAPLRPFICSSYNRFA